MSFSRHHIVNNYICLLLYSKPIFCFMKLMRITNPVLVIDLLLWQTNNTFIIVIILLDKPRFA